MMAPGTPSEFSAVNLAYLQELWERYEEDPLSVDPETRAYFEQDGAIVRAATPPPVSRPPSPVVASPIAEHSLLASAAAALAGAIRAHGYRAASLDPLGSPPPGDAELLAEAHGLREEDLAALPASVVGGPCAAGMGNALLALRALRRVYQGTTGYVFEHVSSADERNWLQEAAESGRFRPPQDPIDERQLLERLTEVGSFERFLQRAFPSQVRFSLEGLGMLVPVLDEIIGAAAEAGTRAVLLGMAHRGRLNVLAHVLGKPYLQIIAEFLDRYQPPGTSHSGSSDEGWTGDVKYHLGARRAIRGGRQVEMVVSLVPNPSHLELVDPVVQGMARATGERRDRPGPPAGMLGAPSRDELGSLCLLIHGDASFPGQGVVAETLNLSRLPGYRVGGTIHIIANNQLGFTTVPELARSTRYASDLARGFEIPVVHVNADDPEACIAAARLAHAYRERFRKDFVLDLVGYRRWGHNEGDEPSFTQPRTYAVIANHPTVRERWAAEMVRRGLVTAAEADTMLQRAIERLHAIRRSLPERAEGEPQEASGLEAGGAGGGLGHAGPAAEVTTGVPLATLRVLNQQLYTLPAGFHLHPKLVRPLERRRTLLDEAGAGGRGRTGMESSAARARLEWAHAEALAFASILADGTPIRLTGEDTARGTFSQRHLVLHDVESGATYTPLQSLAAARASFEVWDSPLSELAALGFEFGYSVAAPDALVVWEAQYGDFINEAQAVIDEFIVSANSKWGQRCSLVLMLPHGYEGQGPDHSSARLERFLQLAAEDNLRIANCTTAAQCFHLLRRQAALLRLDPRPLVFLTPKSLLRHPLASSPAEDLAEGAFQPILDDRKARQEPEVVRRLLLCSGKVWVDLAAAGRLDDPGPRRYPEVAVVRVEELYPFPAAEIGAILAAYPNLEEVVWVQEEPRNMGGWTYAAPRLRDLIQDRWPLRYVGRPRRASPAEGSHEWHIKEQTRLVEAALVRVTGDR